MLRHVWESSIIVSPHSETDWEYSLNWPRGGQTQSISIITGLTIVGRPGRERAIYLFSRWNTLYYPGYMMGYAVLDPVGGSNWWLNCKAELKGSPPLPYNHVLYWNFGDYMTTASSGQLYMSDNWPVSDLFRISISSTLTAGPWVPMCDEWCPACDGYYYWFISHYIHERVPGSRFEGLAGGVPFGGPFVVDDMGSLGGYLMVPRTLGTGGGQTIELGIWSWSTGRYIYGIPMPNSVAEICMGPAEHVYVMLSNRVVMLVNYVRGEILGAAKLPPASTGVTYGNESFGFFSGRAYFDKDQNRLLIAELTPNEPDSLIGACTVRVRGYQFIPEPLRITPPIPLKAPRQGRHIPVLTEVLDDMNKGVGQYIVNANVSGSGSMTGLPFTNHMGKAIIPVALEGNEFFNVDQLPDWETSGSPDAVPPHAGLVSIGVRATSSTQWEQIDQGDTSPGPGCGWSMPYPWADDYLPPGSGVDEVTGYPETAPNMSYLMKPMWESQTTPVCGAHRFIFDGDWWRCQMCCQGPGGFIDGFIRAAHDVDDRWGYLKISGGGSLFARQWMGHASDMAVRVHPDGLTAEVFRLMKPTANGWGSTCHLIWEFIGRSAEYRARWYWPKADYESDEVIAAYPFGHRIAGHEKPNAYYWFPEG